MSREIRIYRVSVGTVAPGSKVEGGLVVERCRGLGLTSLLFMMRSAVKIVGQ